MDAGNDACRVMVVTFGQAIPAVKFPLHVDVGAQAMVAVVANACAIPDARRLALAAMAVT
jgi:hypothetical protein